ncbi:DUF6461 domain-containing protein [Saccharothrix sp.]|uniref:DUF6461 domain-containing protein n=1 Tax=Saccharothrix sp. TaxID=1873460 RepID=UPI0028110EBF|nr:DUF6461 domain-containing protein [Saccharothrix sp.]
MLREPAEADDVTIRYAWVNEIEAMTVAIVRGSTSAQVLDVYGGNPTSVGDYPFAQLADLQGDGTDMRFHVQFIDLDDRVVVLENNGWSGSLPEIARRCSADGGEFFSVYWNVNGFGLVTAADDGTVTARFEHLYPYAPQAAPHEVRPDWAIGPEVEVETATQVCFALMEQRTGVEFDPSWLAVRRPTYQVPDPHWLYRRVEGADKP